MRTISIIQENIMRMRAKSDFKEALNTLMENYNIKDNIFAYENGVKEVCKGYFVPSGCYESLDEAFDNATNENSIRIIDNSEFQLGNVYRHLSECKDAETIFDIETTEGVC